MVRKGEKGDWVPADRVQGLLSHDMENLDRANNGDADEESIASGLGEAEIKSAPPAPKSPQLDDDLESGRPIAVPVVPRPLPPQQLPEEPDSMPLPSIESPIATCPYCLEEIKVGAVKCRHCHEFLSDAVTRKPAKAGSVKSSPNEQQKDWNAGHEGLKSKHGADRGTTKSQLMAKLERAREGVNGIFAMTIIIGSLMGYFLHASLWWLALIGVIGFLLTVNWIQVLKEEKQKKLRREKNSKRDR